MQNLVDVLSIQARELGDKRAFSFVRDGSGEDTSLTYADLDARARAVATRLQASLQPGDRALLLYPSGLDFIGAFFGCLYAGVVAVPVSPPRRRRASASLLGIWEASRPAAVLSTASQCEQARDFYADLPGLLEQPWIASDALPEQPRSSWRQPQLDGGTLAFLQYTSGSTAEPKGVMLSHRNLLHNLELIRDSFGNTQDSSAVFWLPLYHDMGLIGGVLQPIYCGGHCTLMAPATFLQRPRLWLETISERRATISGGPDFAYDLCVRRISPAEREGLDLGCWELAFTGAEPIRRSTLDEFSAAFAGCGFRRRAFFPCYGLAEATLMVCGGPRAADPTVLRLDRDGLAAHRVRPADPDDIRPSEVVACGPPLGGQQVVVVEPATTTPLEENQVGEIWIRGGSVAQGYFEQPDATTDTFAARLAGEETGGYLRTGDLGFLQEGQLYVTGRLKDLIIIRGRNYYPVDIEATVAQVHPAFRAGHTAAFSVDGDGRERLVVVQEIEPRHRVTDVEPALQAIRAAVLDDHDLELHGILLTTAGAIPKTTSGKTRRALCRQLYLNSELRVVAEWQAELLPEAPPSEEAAFDTPPRSVTPQEVEAWLIARLADRLPHVRTDIRTLPFLEFGLGSLDAVRMINDLEQWLGRRLSPTAIYNYPNIVALAAYLARSPEPAPHPAAPRPGGPHPSPLEGGDLDLLGTIRLASDEQLADLIQQEFRARQG